MPLLGCCAPASHVLQELLPAREQQQVYSSTKSVSQEMEKSQMHGFFVGMIGRESDLNEGLGPLQPLVNHHLPILKRTREQ